MIDSKDECVYVSARTGSGAIILTEFYLLIEDDEELFIAIRPIEVISLGFNQNESGEIIENLFYRKYIKFSDETECVITDIESATKLSPSSESYYLNTASELYPIKQEVEEEITKEVKDATNLIIGNFINKNKTLH